MIAGGVLTAAGFATTVWETGPGKLAYLDSLVVDPMQSQAAAVLLFLGYLGLTPMFFAFGAMTRSRARIAGNVAMAISWIGALALSGLLVTDFYDLAIRQQLPADLAVQVSDAAQNLPLGIVIGGPMIMLTFVGTVIGAIAGWRAGFFHWAFALLVVASNAVTMIAQWHADQRRVRCGGLFMVTVGVAVLRMTNREWATGERR